MPKKLLPLAALLLLCAATSYIAYIRLHPAEPSPPSPPSPQDAASPTADLDKQLRDLSNQLARIKIVDPVAHLPGHTDGLTSVAFSPDGKLLATGSGDCTVKLWRVSDRTLLRTFEAHQQYIVSLAFSPDSKILLSSDTAGNLVLWNVEKLELLDRRVQPGFAAVVAFLPDNKHFLTTHYGGLLRWSISSSEPETVQITDNPLTALAVSPQGEVVVGTVDGSVARCNPLSGQVLATHDRLSSLVDPLPGDPFNNRNSIYTLRYLQNGDILIDDHDALWRWNPKTDDIQVIFRISLAQVAPFDHESILAIHDFAHFGFISTDNLWETVYADLDEIHGIAASPDGTLIAVAQGGSRKSEEWTPGGPHDLLLYDTTRILHYRELKRQIEDIQRLRAAARHSPVPPATQINHARPNTPFRELTPWK